MPSTRKHSVKLVKCGCGWDVEVMYKVCKGGYLRITDYTCICGKKYEIWDYYNAMTSYREV